MGSNTTRRIHSWRCDRCLSSHTSVPEWNSLLRVFSISAFSLSVASRLFIASSPNSLFNVADTDSPASTIPYRERERKGGREREHSASERLVHSLSCMLVNEILHMRQWHDPSAMHSQHFYSGPGKHPQHSKAEIHAAIKLLCRCA